MSDVSEALSQLPGNIMIAAFDGWNDAGDAASNTVEHLTQLWDGQVIQRIDPEEYHDFQVNRPIVRNVPGGDRSIVWPQTVISQATLPGSTRSVVLVHGIEPSMKWRRFCAEIITAAKSLNVTTVIVVGALLADVPHTRPVPISLSSDDPAMQALLSIEANDYEGPTGIVGVLHDHAVNAGLNSVSLWAAVPHYVAHPPAPKATIALLSRLEDLLGVPIAVDSLREDADAWQRAVDQLADEDEEIAQYVQQLETVKDTAELPEASGEAIAQEFERFLRRRGRFSADDSE
ncbi:PAC2 family protein [Micrococcales bacterium KH10]|nr:PAC2 family protein [Micrococcales bacterium KH10]